MNNRTRTQGFSLIELMVAITLGLVLLAGVAQVFVNSKQGYRVQESVGRLQENARFATDYLGRYLRVADFWSGLKPATNASSIAIVGGTTYGGVGACANAWIVNPADGIHGYDGATAVTGLADPPQSCVGASYVANSDILVIRFVDPDTYINTATLLSSNSTQHTTNIANGLFYLRTLVGNRGELFNLDNNGAVSSAATTVANNDLPVADPTNDPSSGVLNYQFQCVVFYLKSDNSSGVTSPTLYMLTLQNNGLTAQPLVDGVEMLKFEYGIDTTLGQLGDTLSVNEYLPASSVTNWSQVLSVRASIIVRGDALDTYTDTASYQMTRNYVYGPADYGGYSNGTKYQRRLIVKEIQFRNRVRQ